MNGVASEYEFEALPELSAGYESEYEGDRESEEFFGALANLARRGVGWLTAPGSPQRQAALTLARQAINQGLPALGRWGGNQAASDQAASWLGGLLPQQEYEWESEFEINPIRKIYPDAMMEHLGHAAAEAHGEAEAESLAGAMIPLAARIVPQAAPTLTRAMRHNRCRAEPPQKSGHPPPGARCSHDRSQNSRQRCPVDVSWSRNDPSANATDARATNIECSWKSAGQCASIQALARP